MHRSSKIKQLLQWRPKGSANIAQKRSDTALQKENIPETATTSVADQRADTNSPSVLVWLLSSILFFLFSGLAVRYFLPDGTGYVKPGGNILKYILGIFGVLTYFIEPVILVLFKPPAKKSVVYPGQSVWLQIANFLFVLLIMIPMMIFTFFRPVFRALLLYISLSYLDFAGGESPFFVILVIGDVLLYYLHKWFDADWLSPATQVIKLLRIKKRPMLAYIGDIFFIFYTAFVYTFWLKMGYGTHGRHINPPGQEIYGLICCWAFATIYIRLPFIEDEWGIAGYLMKMPKRILVSHMIILAVSLVAYLWPYFFG